MNSSRRGGKPVIYGDGAVAPERAGVGVVLTDEAGRISGLLNRTLPAMTSTEAEYAALLLALEMALAHHLSAVEIRLDSEVVVYQMSGRYAVNSPRLKRSYHQACESARKIAQVEYVHVPREQNALADALASDASAGRLWLLGSAPHVLGD
jgi:ribonuclease HI/probable phosphoglycerate mutase